MTPESVGLKSNRMVLGRHSGRAGFKDRIIRLGFDPKPEELDNAYLRFLEIADKKKEVFDEDISALFQSETRKTQVEGKFELISFEQSTGSNKTPTSHLTLNVEKHTKQSDATGDGPVDSIFKAIDKITGIYPLLSRLVISPVTEGTDAMAEASVTIEYEGKRVVGKGDSTDIIEACAKAYIDALNRL